MNFVGQYYGKVQSVMLNKTESFACANGDKSMQYNGIVNLRDIIEI